MHTVHMALHLFAGAMGKNSFIGKRLRINSYRFLKMGKNCRIGNDCRMSFYHKFGGNSYQPELLIGDKSYIGDFVTFLCADKIHLEEEVLMASYITITTENHGINPEDTNSYGKQPLTTAPVLIKSGAWIGERVMILLGVTIGRKSIVAAGAVVTKSVPDYCMVAGNPARIIKRYNFEKHVWEKAEVVNE